MKKLYNVLLAISVPFASDAQIVLNASMAPPTGSMFIYYDANTPVPPFTFGKTGTNNIWDFTAISPLPSQEDTVFIVDPSTLAGSSAFPSATHAIREHSDVSYSIININASGATYLGGLGDIFGTGSYMAAPITPPFTAITFPYTYGSNNSGVSIMEIFATGAAIGQPTVDSVRYKSTISSSHFVLASGNMIIPSGTFGALLERQINSNLHSAWLKGAATGNQWVPAPGFPSLETDSSFYWYTTQAVQKFAHVLYDNTGLHDVVFLKSTTVGINEEPASTITGIYPNPAKNILNFITANVTSSEYQFQVFDVSGKEVMHGTGHLPQLNVSKLIPGIYNLTISVANKPSVTHRFVKN
ncbi:MAG TPA: T9SS type A sorting domain-containing protein [Bacteroidia bacterium]|nr:T9SS type A sorting domain-containing protein [Bacteroidia bacterium]